MILHKSPLSNYLAKYESIYPGISLWWERRVEIDVASGTKIIYREDRNFDVVALTVFDLKQSKLCHMSLDHAVRGTGLGRAMLNQVKREAKYNGLVEIWAHGPEDIAHKFQNWTGAILVGSMGNFGRTGMNDVKLTIQVS